MAASAAALSLNSFRREALLTQRPQNPVRQSSDRLHLLRSDPAVAVKYATEGSVNSTSAGSEKREDFSQMFGVALRRRLYPNTGLHIKQFAYAMQRSEATVWSWMAGNRSVRGDDFMACIAFFGADFASELLAPHGCMVVKLGDARAAAARKILEGYAELKAVEGAR